MQDKPQAATNGNKRNNSTKESVTFMIYHLTYLGQAANYSCGTYGQSTYNANCQQGAASSSSGSAPSAGNASASGGLLANTGFDVIVPIALAVSILGASAILLIKKIRRSIKAS